MRFYLFFFCIKVVFGFFFFFFEHYLIMIFDSKILSLKTKIITREEEMSSKIEIFPNN